MHASAVVQIATRGDGFENEQDSHTLSGQVDPDDV